MGNIADDEFLAGTGTVQELDGDCPACGGIGMLLGVLGSATWLRCRDCGMEFRARPVGEPIDFTIDKQGEVKA